MPSPQEVVDQLIPHRKPAKAEAVAFAPANIALCKYWGKRHEELKLPVTGSLSISLGHLGTRMQITASDTDTLVINGEEITTDSKVYTRLFDFIDLVRDHQTPWHIRSENTIPTGAGLASSASAFAATVKALNDLYDWNLPAWKQSVLARLGSGSACRSVYQGFAEWRCGLREDGLDSYAAPLRIPWPDFRIGILTVSNAPKPVGSTAGMQRTMSTSTLYESWPEQVKHDLPRIRDAVYARDIASLGPLTEQNALSMHATMIAAWPAVLYWQPETLVCLHQVQQARADGLQVYATLDAGPNVKLIFLVQEQPQIQALFPGLQVVDPFAASPRP